MRTIVVDVESYYDSEYSLRKMTPVEYILDPRWETIGWAVKDNGAETVWMTDAEFRSYLAGLPEKVAMVSHNALFDMCVLAWRYDYVPHLMIDTLGMARAWLGHKLKSLALASVAAHLGIGFKGDTVHKVQGMGLAAIKAAGFYDEYAEYSKTDADLCWTIYRRIVNEGFPVQEILIMDTVLRCAVQPRFVLDQTLLAEHLHSVQSGKQALMDRIGTMDTTGNQSARDLLMSNDQFAEALRALGVEPPTKISLTTGKETYAFAKTDAAFIELEEHDNPDVQALVSARLGVKSTIEETRTERLLNISRLTWPGNATGLMPMPLRYSGAHTHRLSGDWKLNMQNLPSRGNNKIRSALKAPEGHAVVAVDASQIEARIAGWFCGADKLTSAFANKEDVYSSFASKLFGYEVKKSTHKVERFIGKTCLAEGTMVVTDSGLVPIEQVTTSHRLWDGVEWVCHSGVVSNGLKKTLPLCGLWLTPDHLVLCGRKWRPALLLEAHSNILTQALDTAAASWSSLVTSKVSAAASPPSSYNANAVARSSQWSAITSRISRVLAALLAGIPLGPRSGTGNTRKSSPTTSTAPDSLTGSLPQSPAAIRAAIERTTTTAGVVFRSTRDGAKTEQSFSGMSRPCPDGTSLPMIWTAPMSTGATSRATSALSAGPRTHGTNGALQTSRPASATLRRNCQVYDLANAGPRRRFMVMTDEGPLIVHNCILGLQYGLGWAKFQSNTKMQSKAQVGEEVVLDDMQATRAVQTYRREYQEIPQMWRRLEFLIQRMTDRNCHEQVGPITFLHEKIRLPSGLYLHYHNLENRDGQWWFTHGGKPKYLYGGKLLENIVQALARICVMDTAARVRRRLNGHDIRLNLQVHDELVYIAPLQQAEALRDMVIEEMCKPPSWGVDIPLDAEGEVGPSYGEAK
jgi:hypothetical protein